MEIQRQKMEQKKGINLVTKILCVVLIPIIVLVIFSGVTIRSVGNEVALKLAKHELMATTYAVEQTFNVLSTGDYTCDGTNLYKGDADITASQNSLDEFKKETGVDVTVFWGDVRMATSITDSNGNRVVGTQAAEDVYEQVTKNVPILRMIQSFRERSIMVIMSSLRIRTEKQSECYLPE